MTNPINPFNAYPGTPEHFDGMIDTPMPSVGEPYSMQDAATTQANILRQLQELRTRVGTANHTVANQQPGGHADLLRARMAADPNMSPMVMGPASNALRDHGARAAQLSQNRTAETRDTIITLINEGDPDRLVPLLSHALNGSQTYERNADSYSDVTGQAAEVRQNELDVLEARTLYRIAAGPRQTQKFPSETPAAYADRVAKNRKEHEARINQSLRQISDTKNGGKANVDKPSKLPGLSAEALHDLHRQAGALQISSEGLSYEIGQIANVLEDHVQNVQTVEANLDSARNNLVGWYLSGEPDVDQAAAVSQNLDEAANTLELLAPRSTARSDLYDELIVARIRLEERVAMSSEVASAPYERRLNHDGSITVNIDPYNPTQQVTLYEDSSVLHFDSASGHMVREYTNGRPWRAPTRPVTPPHRAEIDELDISDEAEVDNQVNHFDIVQEVVRTRAAAADVTHIHELRIDQAQAGAAESAVQLTAVDAQLTTLQSRVRAQQVAEATVISNHAPGIDEGQYSHEERKIMAAGRELRNQIAVAQGLRNNHLQNIIIQRIRENRSQFRVARMRVGDPFAVNESGYATSLLRPDGSVLVPNSRLNGRTGNWVIYPDGSSRLFAPNGALVASYSDAGVYIP